jgi:hypothetical protein
MRKSHLSLTVNCDNETIYRDALPESSMSEHQARKGAIPRLRMDFTGKNGPLRPENAYYWDAIL